MVELQWFKALFDQVFRPFRPPVSYTRRPRAISGRLGWHTLFKPFLNRTKKERGSFHRNPGFLQILNGSPMAIASDETTRICNHCDRAIPSSNIDLHYAHCSRNLEKCKVCGDMIPIKYAEEHFLDTHAPVACSLCSETMERGNLDIHKGENCPQRIVTCEFCEFPLPAIDLAEHQEVCGNRTEMCYLCNRYIRLRERYNHETRCTGIAENNLESSRDVRAAEREQGAPRRQPPEYSRRRLLFTIAITGIAVLFGSLFFQKKAETAQVH
ncbi:hypothetical protein GQ457_16G016310 [Hibiscus cannabinus]